MKNIKQIRENQISLSENVESSADVRKLSMLVRAGLFDPNKLTMLKRALNKDNVKMTRAERDALLELLDRLLTTVMANQGTFMKVKQSIQEELSPEQDGEFSMARSDLKTSISSAQRILDKLNGEGKLEAWLQSKITLASDYLSSAANYVDSGEAELKEDYEEYDIENLDEGSKIDVDINQIPSLIIMKRRAIRVFPDGQKVALYWADRINKYISVPFQSIGISEDYDPKDKKSKESDRVSAYFKTQSDAKRAKAKEMLGNKTLKKSISKEIKNAPGSSTLYNVGYGIGAGIRKRVKLGMAKRRAMATVSKFDTAGLPIRESYQNKLIAIREQRQVNEALPLIPLAVGAARVAIPAIARSAAGRAAAGAAAKYGKKAVDLGKKLFTRGKPKVPKVKPKVKPKGKGKLGAAAAGAAAGSAVSGGSNDGGGSSAPINIRVQRPDSVAFKGSRLSGTDPYKAKRARDFEKSASQNEGNESLKALKTISEGSSDFALNFIDGTINVSPSVASKIVETYNALNVENKKLVQEMINSDKNSFMKFANFASSK